MTGAWCLDSRSRRSWPGNGTGRQRRLALPRFSDSGACGALELQLQVSYT